MVKSVIKEVFIILLLIVAILLILGILFYQYMPTTKNVPSKVAEYTLPEEMEQELEETIEASETQNIVRTYRVEADELERAERADEYEKGKPNPFSMISSDAGAGQNNDTNNRNSTSQNGNSNQGSFLNEVK